MKAAQYVLDRNELYKKTPQGVLIVCIDHDEAKQVMSMVHDGDCGAHMNARILVKKILKKLYWNTIEADCIKYVKTCHNC